jgi:hypothetical protein
MYECVVHTCNCSSSHNMHTVQYITYIHVMYVRIITVYLQKYAIPLVHVMCTARTTCTCSTHTQETQGVVQTLASAVCLLVLARTQPSSVQLPTVRGYQFHPLRKQPELLLSAYPFPLHEVVPVIRYVLVQTVE